MNADAKTVGTVALFVFLLFIAWQVVPTLLKAENEFGEELGNQTTGDETSDDILDIFAWFFTSWVGGLATLAGVVGLCWKMAAG